ncbi:hypothetical protein H5410_022567 [Solanum commersonii]|uniref:Transcription factor n=1 Tax=Solanum commersonii TaxID=4109 RepID=A0A9J5ZJG6_SOLCO|nr:hypothetical protein H5410_022567 [Solanum commersonii]
MNVVDIRNNNIIGDNGEPGKRQNVSNTTEQRNNSDEAGYDVGSNGKYKLTKKRDRKNMNEIDEREHQSSDINMAVRRKACTVWNDDLHANFMKVVHQIGKERCRPKKILEQMNVLDITRAQKRKNLLVAHQTRDAQIILSKEVAFKNLGQCLSCFQANVTNMQRDSNRTQIVPEFPFPTLETNNTFFEGESSIQQLYRPQHQAQPHYPTIGNPFNNSSLWTKTYFDGELQQQHGPLREVLGSQGLHISNIESTNSRPNLMFNRGYHNMNHNVSHGASYSGSKKMSNTNVGNAITNDNNLNTNADNVTTFLGNRLIHDIHVGNTFTNEFSAIDTNFQQYISKSNKPNSSNIVVATNDHCEIEESDSNEKQHYDAYFDFNNIDYLSQNLEPPSTDPSSE